MVRRVQRRRCDVFVEPRKKDSKPQFGPSRGNQRKNRNTSKETLVDAVRLDLQNITRTATSIDLSEPGFADTFRPPG